MAPRKEKIEPISWRKLPADDKKITSNNEWIQKTKKKLKKATESLSSLRNFRTTDNYDLFEESPTRVTRSSRRLSALPTSPMQINHSKRAIKKMKSLTRITGDVIKQTLRLKSAHHEFQNSPETTKLNIPRQQSPRTPRRIRMGVTKTPDRMSALTEGIKALSSNCDALTTPKSIRIRTTAGGRRRNIIK